MFFEDHAQNKEPCHQHIEASQHLYQSNQKLTPKVKKKKTLA
jgi:hypothetical protein